MKISMLFSSCDSYDDAWIPFFTQLKKFWPEFNMPIYIGAESKTFQFEGLDIRCPLSNGPVYRQWSKRLLKLLEYIDTDYVLFTLDDFWLTAPVDNTKFERILSYMEKDKRIGFVCLKQEIVPERTSEKDMAAAVECQYPELWRCLKDKSFRITTQFGLWKRSYLIKILRAHESAWYFETRATWRSKFCWERIYDVKESITIYPVGGFLGGGKCYEDYKNLFDSELIRPCVEKRGLIHFGDLRSYPSTPKGFCYYWSLFLSMIPRW